MALIRPVSLPKRVFRDEGGGYQESKLLLWVIRNDLSNKEAQQSQNEIKAILGTTLSRGSQFFFGKIPGLRLETQLPPWKSVFSYLLGISGIESKSSKTVRTEISREIYLRRMYKNCWVSEMCTKTLGDSLGLAIKKATVEIGSTGSQRKSQSRCLIVSQNTIVPAILFLFYSYYQVQIQTRTKIKR